MRPSLVRKVATGVLLLDALAIGAAAVHVEDVVTRSTTALPPAASAPAAPGSALDVSPGTPGAPVRVVPVGDPGDPFADVLAQLGATAGTANPPSNGTAPTVPPAPVTGGVPPDGSVAPCPIPLDDPGLQAAVSPVLTPLASSLDVLLVPGLDAGTRLAAALAPYTHALTSTELGGCIAELQNVLLATGTPSTPGTTGVAEPTTVGLSALGLGGLR